MPRLIAVLLLALCLLPLTWLQNEVPRKNDSQQIRLVPVPLNIDNPAAKRLGLLDYRGGWQLLSDNSDFGGFSAMHVGPNNDFTLLSDSGAVARFRLDAKDSRAMAAKIGLLPDGPAKPNPHASRVWDAESMIFDPANGRIWVGFEQQHGIWRFAPDFAKVEAKRNPAIMRDWPSNGGAEAMLHLPDGRWAVFSEHDRAGKGRTTGLLFSGDPTDRATTIRRFAYRPPPGYAITAATLLPDGRALLLHRRFRPTEGVRAKLSIADPAGISPGKQWSGRVIATFEPPVTVDNMEAIAVTQEDGEIIVWIASDDNYNPLQRSLLLKFAMRDEKKRSAQRKTGPTRPGFESLD